MFLSTSRKEKKQMPEFSKRRFLGRLGAVFVGSTVLSSGIIPFRAAKASTIQAGEKDMSSSRNEFSPYIGENFQLTTQENAIVDLKLTEVTDRSARVNTADKGKRQECFSMIFQGTGNAQLPQSTYTFKHNKMGQFDLFIVPVGRNQAGVEYEAVINRIMG